MTPWNRAYGPWDFRVQRFQRFVTTEAELRAAIAELAGAAVNANRLVAGGLIVIAAPMTVSATITIPNTCTGLTITATSRLPIRPLGAGTIGAVFDVKAEFCTIRDLFIYGDATNFAPTFVTAHDPAISGRSALGLNLLNNEVFVDAVFTDLSAGKAGRAHIAGNKQTRAGASAAASIVIDSSEGSVVDNSLKNTAGNDAIRVTANGGNIRIVGNDCTNGNITTSASAGSNELAGNIRVGTKTLAASDVDDAKLDSLAIVNSATLVTSAGGVPSWSATLPAGRLLGPPVVIQNPTTSYAKTAGTRRIVVELVGAGGGGGGCTAVASNCGAAGGGAAGAYAEKSYDVSALAGPFTVAVGAGGLAGANTGGTGGTGGDTTFTDGTTLVTAKGGVGGVGQAAGTTLAATLGGSGVVATNGDVNGIGQAGAPGIRLSGTVGVSGAGGGSPFGGGGNGSNVDAAGVTPTGFGGGGGGALSLSAARAGGVGAKGVIRIWEFS